MPAPLVIVNAVGLTKRLLPQAPRLRALAERGWVTSFREVLPAVTCTAQATLLTGTMPNEHGIVANGWLFRDTQEVRFWQQANQLIQSEPVYATARRVAQHLERRRGARVHAAVRLDELARAPAPARRPARGHPRIGRLSDLRGGRPQRGDAPLNIAANTRPSKQ